MGRLFIQRFTIVNAAGPSSLRAAACNAMDDEPVQACWNPMEREFSAICHSSAQRQLEVPGLEAVGVITGQAEPPLRPSDFEAGANILRRYTGAAVGRDYGAGARFSQDDDVIGSYAPACNAARTSSRCAGTLTAIVTRSTRSSWIIASGSENQRTAPKASAASRALCSLRVATAASFTPGRPLITGNVREPRPACVGVCTDDSDTNCFLGHGE